MAFPLQLRLGKRSLRWSGGGLLLLVSLGLHGLLLGLPLAEADPASPDLTTELDEPVEVIDVVRLPAAPETAGPEATAPETAQPETVVPAAIAPQVAPPTAAPQAIAPTPPAVAPAPAPVDLEPLPPEPPPQTLDDRLRDPESYAFNQQAKSLIADEVTFHMVVVSDWIEAEGVGITNDDLLPIPGEKLPPLQVAYPLNSCLSPPPAEGVVGVIVDAAGQRLEAPVLLDSTGYSVLDDKAIEMAMERAFPAQPAGSPLPNPRGHWLPVQVQYDADGCNS
ncbi:MAG: hypothetical protein ACFCVB_16735 [Nodosilinea sp.]